MIKQCLIILLLALVLAPVCRAQEEQLWDAIGMDELARAGEQYDAGVELSPDIQLDRGLDKLLERGAEHLPGVLRKGLSSAVSLLVIVIACAMAEGMRAAGTPQGGLNVCIMAGALAITAVSANEMSAMMGLGRSTIDRMQGFSQILLPISAACTAATGAPTAAAVRQVATALFSSLLLSLIDRVLVPLVYAYVVACTAHAAVGNPGLDKVAGVLKWVATRALSALLVLFVTYLTVSGAIAGTADAAALKAAKMAISTAVPVVGGIIANAADTILVGAGLLKNTVGVFGMLAVLGICIVPFLQLGAQYLTYKFCGALAATLADSRLAKLIDSIGTAFALMLGMTGASALLLLVSIVSGLAGGGR